MRNRAVATRYAQALVATAKKMGVLDDVAESFDGVMAVFADSANVLRFLAGPHIDETKKKDVINNVFGSKVEPVLLHFFMILVEKQRMENVVEIHGEFTRLMESERGMTRAHVTTAVPLTDDLEQALAAKLGQVTGGTIVLEKEVDPSVLGGVCVTMGDRVIDGTIRTNLERLRTQLSQADVR
jgi:F-type H+-transporting ATPase subunit delta